MKPYSQGGHLENTEIRGKSMGNIFEEKSQGKSWKTVIVSEKSGKNEIILANIPENVYIAHYISVFVKGYQC